MPGQSTHSYSLIENGPSAWSWEDYEQYLSAEWPKCLDNATSEPDVQSFLEMHPCLVPGGQAGEDSEAGHHGPFYGALITQPELAGSFSRRPDFMWLTRHSGAVIPVLIEIEDPAKRWYTKTGQETAELTQARTQLTEWQTWLKNPGNETVFRDRYELNGTYSKSRSFEPLFWLVFGRRVEATSRAIANEGRQQADRLGTKSMTFDRLTPEHGSRNAITIRHAPKKLSTVVHIPPTFQLGPHMAHHLDQFAGWDDAIERNVFLKDERKQFLRDRIPYWIRWHQSTGTNIYSPSDWE